MSRYRPHSEEVNSWVSAVETRPLLTLMEEASALRRQGHGHALSFSPKVFIPLTELCRDACGYCTFAKPPRAVPNPYLRLDQVLEIARKGADANCSEALFTLGDRPEQRYSVAASALAELGHERTPQYLAEIASEVQQRTGLLAHINAGIMSVDEMALMRSVSVSQGIMLESIS